jgi:ABC-2 type transport system ATP-binding protein
MDNVISVEHLSKRYGDVTAVVDVHFTVNRGEIFGILGPNGAGKTTTVEILQGLRPRSTGRVSVLGLDPNRSGTELRRRIGSQLQAAALPARLRVGEAIRLFAYNAHGPVDTDAVLDEWELRSLRHRPFAALSGGQQQRLFLALALLGAPEVVFLDELTTGLDPHARRATWDLVRRVRDRGATVCLVTHFMEEAEELCDRVAVVDRGRVVALDTPNALTTALGGAIRISFSTTGDVSFLSRVPGVERVADDGATTTVSAVAGAVAPVATALAERGLIPPDFRTHYPTLEDVFLSVTGRSLRHEPEGTPR